MFADCLITSLGFGTRTLQIHDHPSYYLHIFPLRIIIALNATAHVLISCRPGRTEVIIFWKWSWWASIVCTVSNKQDEVGRFPSPPLWSGSKITFPLFHHSAMQDMEVVYVLLKSELVLNGETRPRGYWIVAASPRITFLSTHTPAVSWLNFTVYKMGFKRSFKNLWSSNLRWGSLIDGNIAFYTDSERTFWNTRCSTLSTLQPWACSLSSRGLSFPTQKEVRVGTQRDPIGKALHPVPSAGESPVMVSY